MTDPRFDLGLYPLPDVARLVGRSPQSVRNWVRGYRYPAAGELVQAAEIIVPTTGDPTVVSFINLVEAVALSAFRRAGVPLQRVRRALEYVAGETEAAHLLASERLLTDGLDLFYGFERETGESVGLVNISRGGQKAFDDVIAEYLREMDWGKDRFATRWWPGSSGGREGGVVVDPRRGFGSPVIVETGIRTEDVFLRFTAGDSVATLSTDFALSRNRIEEALRFEAGLRDRLAA
ncbi:MAG: DUF433 domain-containing protein [Actinomycetota bacterium]